MSLTESIPGMTPGATGRNVALGVGYVGAGFVALALLIVLFPILAIVAAVAASTNYRGLADRLSALPGIGAGGGATAGIATFAYVIVGGIVLAGLIGGLGGPSDTVPSGPGTADGTSTATAPPGGAGADDKPPAAGDPPTTGTTAPGAGATQTPSPDRSGTIRSPDSPPGGATATAAATATSTTRATATASTGPQSSWTVEVVRIVDGDTMEVRFDDGHTENVRLLGVDTPEVHTENDPAEFEGIPDNEEGRQWLRDWGHKSSEFARSELAGSTVRIETDEEADRRWSYGRLLVYLTHDGKEFNQQLLRQGYARMYESQFSKRGTYEQLEADAQAGDVGLWNYGASRATPTPTPMPDGGSESPLAVAEIHADASGNDHENLNDEYIVFENRGESALEMGGWVVEDEKNHEYIVPSGFTLEPGAQVTLYTGSGEDTESKLYWGSDSAVWNNGGDTIYVRDDSGSLVLERSYS